MFRQTPRPGGDGGFSLLEAIVATGIVAVAVSALAQVVTLAVYANVRARQTTVAPILAQQKIEELFAQAAISPLDESPDGTLENDADGFYDFLDSEGRLLGATLPPPAGSVYRRRWSVDPMPGSSAHTSVVQVVVSDVRRAAVVNGPASAIRQPGGARLVAAIAGRGL